MLFETKKPCNCMACDYVLVAVRHSTITLTDTEISAYNLTVTV